MASNKNQHFVPKCFLRSFAIPGTEAINLYNIDRRTIIERASLKHQCSGDYFYGKDQLLDRAIKSVEDSYADSLRKVLAPGFVLTELHRNVLTYFILLQHLRTEAVALRTVAMADATRSVIGFNESRFRVGIREAVQIAMRTFAESMNVLSDLKLCLVRNRTSTPFFASDNPAILTNRWQLQSLKTNGWSFGVTSAGCLLLLPLTPRVLCLGYDGDIYVVPHKDGWVEARREADIEAFNEHQFLHCNANIFFGDSAYATLVHDAFARSIPNRPSTRHRIHYAVEDKHEGDYTRYRVVDRAKAGDHKRAMIHSQVINPSPAAWPRIISWRPRGFAFTNGSGVGYVRRARVNPSGDRPYRKVLTNA